MRDSVTQVRNINGISVIIQVLRTTKRQQANWLMVIYYSLLVLVTDCFIWLYADSLSGYSWQYLVLYSLMSYPLWMIIALKGVAKEQVDLLETSSWHVADLLPCSPTFLFIAHYAGRTVKQSSLHVWLVVYVILGFYNSSSILLIMLGIASLTFGAINLVLTSIVTKYYSPKGYSSVLQSIFYNITWIFSGAVIPLGMISQSPWFYVFNPFSAAISSPLLVLSSHPSSQLDQIMISQFIGNFIWLFLLLLLALRAERKRRAKFY